VHSAEVNGIGAARLLECLRLAGKGARFYQASTSEMIGPGADGPQDENAVFLPRSPYAAGKLFAHHLVATYRQGYGLFACSGITFNHESPLRPPGFVTRKITMGLARLKLGLQPVLELGNVDAERDWGHAADYVQAIWLMLQRDDARDYVLATGCTNSVRTFVDLAAGALGVSLDWEGEGLTARARERKTGRVWVRVDPAFMRPIDLPRVSGNPRRAEEELGWSRSYDLPALVEEMAARDYDRVTGGQAAMPAGPLAARS
jgi:GDPmannose 4,6-dehydratase